MTSTAEPWWKSAVTYQIYPRSFFDSSGRGTGDLNGINSRLDYLKNLGVDALWVNPFYPSPQIDGGYDVADYCGVDPDFGSLEDFDALLAGAHARGLRVIVDLIPNHSSDQHPLFQAALAGGPGSDARDVYHFRDGLGEGGSNPPNNWRSVFGGSSWTRVVESDGAPGQWYYHLFAAEQPDFNWQNPAVANYFESVLRFWLDRGVDGFRIDVSDALIKDDTWPDTADGSPVIPKDEDSPVHGIYRRFREILDEYEDAMAVIETGAEDEVVALFLRPDEMHQAFNFRFLKAGWDAGQIASAVAESMEVFAAVGAEATWVTDNHDTTRSATRYAATGGLAGAYLPQTSGGVEAPAKSDSQEALGWRRARAMAVLLLCLPGSAYLYAGQELGLPEVTDLPDEVRADPAFFRTAGAMKGRDGCRVPLPWEGASPPFGFTSSKHTWLPQPDGWRALTVESQLGDPESMLTLYQHLLRSRREEPALGTGSVQWVEPPDRAAETGLLHLRFVPRPDRSTRGRPRSVELLMNFNDYPVVVPQPDQPHEVLVASSPIPSSPVPGGAGVIGGNTAILRAPTQPQVLSHPDLRLDES